MMFSYHKLVLWHSHECNFAKILQISSLISMAQDCSNSIANALELLQSCAKPWIWVWKALIPDNSYITHGGANEFTCYFDYPLLQVCLHNVEDVKPIQAKCVPKYLNHLQTSFNHLPDAVAPMEIILRILVKGCRRLAARETRGCIRLRESAALVLSLFYKCPQYQPSVP